MVPHSPALSKFYPSIVIFCSSIILSSNAEDAATAAPTVDPSQTDQNASTPTGAPTTTAGNHQSLSALTDAIFAQQIQEEKDDDDGSNLFDDLDDPTKNPFNNPCWDSGDGYSFKVCCDTEVHGPMGNVGCWDQVFSWKVCCEEETWLRREAGKERDRVVEEQRKHEEILLGGLGGDEDGENGGDGSVVVGGNKGTSKGGKGEGKGGTFEIVTSEISNTLFWIGNRIGVPMGSQEEEVDGSDAQTIIQELNGAGARKNFKMQSSLYLERVHKLNVCIEKYEEYFPRLVSFTGSRDQAYGDPFGCVAMNLRFFWALLNGVLLGICVPAECEMIERAVSGPIVTMLTGKLMGVRWGCMDDEKKLGLLTKFPAEFSPAPRSEEEEKILEKCEIYNRRYFPTNDVIRLKLLISELKDEMAARSEELEVVVYEHTDKWQFSADSWQWLRLIFGPVLICSVIELFFWLLLGTPVSKLNTSNVAKSSVSTLRKTLHILGAPVRFLRNFLLRPLSLQSGLSELFQPPRAAENVGLMVVRIWLTIIVISVHTIEAYEWELQDSSRSFLEIEYWPIYCIAHLGHRVNTPFVLMSSYLLLKSLRRSLGGLRRSVADTTPALKKTASLSSVSSTPPAKRSENQSFLSLFFHTLIKLPLTFCKQIIQRLSRQSPIMFFYCLWQIKLAQDVPWRPQDVVEVWYKFRPDVCGSGYRWFFSSIYLHSWYSGDYTREGLCHNSAVFEAEFLAISCLLFFVLCSQAVRKILGKVLGKIAQVAIDGVELAVMGYAICAVAKHNYEYAVGRTTGEKFSRNPYLELAPRSAMYLGSIAILVYFFEEYGPDWGKWARWVGKKIHFGSSNGNGASNSSTGIDLEYFLRILFAAVPLIGTIVIDLAIFCRGKYLIFDNAPQKLYWMRTWDKPIFRFLFELGWPVREFQKNYLEEQPMLLDFLLDFPCTVGFYHLLKLLDGGSGGGQKVSPSGGTVSALTSESLKTGEANEEKETLVPRNNGNIIKSVPSGSSEVSSTTTSTVASSPDDVVPSTSTGNGVSASSNGTSNGHPNPVSVPAQQSQPTSVVNAPVRSVSFASIISKLAFGTNLSNIFILHYLFCYLNAQKTRMTYPSVLSMIGFVFATSAAFSAVTFLFLEHPCKNLVGQWILKWL